MHTIIGITAYENDIPELERYIKGLKEVQYFRKINFYDVITSKEDAAFIGNLIYPSSAYQKLYNKIPSMIKKLIETAGIKLVKPRPEIKRQNFLVRSKLVLAVQSEDEWNGIEELI